MQTANRRCTVSSAEERRTAKTQQAQANEQLALLERGTSSGGSDFYTYRYLATEGFLPGYNFPRLPLYAYVPAIGSGPGARAAYLQRARFLAIAEFGPRSLIYHEGRAFRVHRAKLPPGVRAEEWRKIARRQRSLFATPAVPSTSRMSRNAATLAAPAWAARTRSAMLLRIDNVETQPAERITANDEERQHQGFDIQTVFAWPLRDGALDVASAARERRRRSDPAQSTTRSGATDQPAEQGAASPQGKSIFGFGIDPATGRWTGSPEEGRRRRPRRKARSGSVSFRSCRTRKNAALLRLSAEPLPEAAMADAAACPGARHRDWSSSSKKARRSPNRYRRARADARSWPTRPPKAEPASSDA